MTRRLIALTGKAGSGKSEVASYLVYGHGFELVKFSGPLKAMLEGFYMSLGMDEHEIYDRIEGDLKEKGDDFLGGASPRFAMQTLGTEWGRHLMGQDFWIDAAEAKIKASKSQYIVVDDCRFTNEAHTIRRLGGEVIQITSNRERRKASTHVSDSGLHPDLIDHTILNDEGIGALRKSIDTYLYGI